MQVRRPLAWLALGALLVSCGSDNTGPRVPANIVLLPNQPTLEQGKTLQLTATVVDANGRAIAGQQPTFASADIASLTVTSSGLLTSVGPTDTVRVTANLGAVSNFVDVIITRRIVGLTVTPDSVVLNVGQLGGITATLVDFLGTPVPTSPTFVSSDASVASVDPFGLVIAAKTGTAIITVTADTFSAQVPVRVIQIAGSIVVSPRVVVVGSSGTFQLVVSVRDILGNPMPAPTLGFQSGAPGLFSVSGTGLVTGLGGIGADSLTITGDTITVRVAVFVGMAPPPGTLVNRVNVPGPAYASAITSTGEIIVTVPTTPNGMRGNISALTFSDTVATLSDPLGVAINPAGTKAYAAQRSDNKIGVMDLLTNGVTHPGPALGGGTLFSTAVSNDGLYVFAGTSTFVYRLDATTLAVIDSVAASDPIHLAVHPTLSLLYVSNNGTGVVTEVNWTTMTVARSFGGGSGVQAVVVAPDGSTLYVANEGGPGITTFDLATGLAGTPIAAQNTFGLAIRGNTLYATSSLANVFAFDRTNGTPIYTLSVTGTPRRPAINAAGILIVPNEGGWVDFIQ